ncbi:uncharacterized protein [Choristoneura fumiferana]|uniref:uncharacterized protein n=1 Tax=Choristoneura fumiferana TaxID=7141 RepID=UPI003D156108
MKMKNYLTIDSSIIISKITKQNNQTMSEGVFKSNSKEDSKMETHEFYETSAKCSDEMSDGDEKGLVMKVEAEDSDVTKAISQRENRLTNIIEQLRSQSELKGNSQRELPLPPTNGFDVTLPEDKRDETRRVL